MRTRIENGLFLWNNSKVFRIEVPFINMHFSVGKGVNLNLSGQQAYLLCNLL